MVQDNFNASSGTGTSWVFTCPLPGRIKISAFVKCSVNNNHTTTDGLYLRLNKNTALQYNFSAWSVWGTATVTPLIAGSCQIDVAAGDTIAVELLNSGGITETVSSDSTLSIAYVQRL